MVAALARRDPNSPLVFHRNGIAIRRWRTAWRTAWQAAGVPTRLLHECRRTAARNPPAPDIRRHATLPQSWIQRENWEFETHRQEVSPLTWRYDLTVPSTGRLRAIVEHTTVADTHYIDRQRYTALLHESSLARTIPTDGILTCRCDMTLVGRGRSSD